MMSVIHHAAQAKPLASSVMATSHPSPDAGTSRQRGKNAAHTQSRIFRPSQTVSPKSVAGGMARRRDAGVRLVADGRHQWHQ